MVNAIKIKDFQKGPGRHKLSWTDLPSPADGKTLNTRSLQQQALTGSWRKHPNQKLVTQIMLYSAPKQGFWGQNLPELLKCRKKTIIAGKNIQIMLNLAKAKPSSLPSFTKQTTIKKISYERENFSWAYQPAPETELQHKQPQQKSLLASDTESLYKELQGMC